MTQSQMQNESQKAYTAYGIYAGMGVGRTIVGSYALYQIAMQKESDTPLKAPKVLHSPSPSYKKWVVDFEWVARVSEYERERSAQIQQSLLDKDAKAYTDRVERLRMDLDKFSEDILVASRISLSISTIRLGLILDRASAQQQPLERPILDEYSAMNRGLVSATSCMAVGFQKISESLGLDAVIQKLTEMNKED